MSRDGKGHSESKHTRGHKETDGNHVRLHRDLNHPEDNRKRKKKGK